MSPDSSTHIVPYSTEKAKNIVSRVLELSLEEEIICKQQQQNDIEINRLQELIHQTQKLLEEKLKLQNDVRIEKYYCISSVFSILEWLTVVPWCCIGIVCPGPNSL